MLEGCASASASSFSERKEPPRRTAQKTWQRVVAGNQGFWTLGSHGARPTHGRDKSPYRSPCNPHVRSL